MGYDFCDINGEVDVPAPTISGMCELSKLIDRQTKGLYPQLTEFINTGVSSHPLLLAEEATILWDKVTLPNQRTLLSNLTLAAKQAKGFLTVVM